MDVNRIFAHLEPHFIIEHGKNRQQPDILDLYRIFVGIYRPAPEASVTVDVVDPESYGSRMSSPETMMVSHGDI